MAGHTRPFVQIPGQKADTIDHGTGRIGVSSHIDLGPLASMLSTSTETDVRAAQLTALRTLAYFDVFHHPLTVAELRCFAAGETITDRDIREALKDLEAEGALKQLDGHWGLTNVDEAVAKRHASAARARARMPKALRMSRTIARFPFVRGVFLSGSMSKGCLAEDGDIDFFVVTSPGRLWVGRTLLILYKKLFLLNSRKDFCVNYFLDTDHLTVEDRNRFTATEVVTLIPTYGGRTVRSFFDHNKWAFAMFPGAAVPKSKEVVIGRAKAKHILERMLSGTIGQLLDSWCMQLTWYRWKRKFSQMDVRTFELALRTRTYVSKHHPRNFQQKVLDAYEKRVAVLEQRFGQVLR